MDNKVKKKSVGSIITLSAFIILLLIYLPLGLSVIFNDHFANDEARPYFFYIYSENGTEYKLKDNMSAKDYYDKLMFLIRSDSIAMFGKKQIGYMSREYNDSAENALIAMSRKKGINKGAGKGPRYYYVSFLVPYDNRNLKMSGNFFHPWINGAFIEYADKIVYEIEIIDTHPVTLVSRRGKDIDEHQVYLNLDKYVELNYLDKICDYKKSNILNWYFFCSKWAAYHFYYVLMIFLAVLILAFSIDRHIKREKLRRIEEDRFLGITD